MRRRSTRQLIVIAGTVAVAAASLCAIPSAAASVASRLAPAYVDTTQVSLHTVKLRIVPPVHPNGLVGYQIYEQHGASSPQSVDSHKPSKKPVATYSGSPARTVHVKVHGLKTMAPYNFVVYGYDKHGHYAGTRSGAVILVNDGLHLDGDSLSIRHATAAGLAIDNAGRRHVIALVKPSQHKRSDNLRVAYATRAAGAKHWKVRTPHATVEGDGGLVSLEASTSGKKVAVLMNLCSGIYTQQTAAKSTSMPTLDRTLASDNCSATDDDALVARGWVQIPHGLAIIAANGEGGDAQVLTGQPGGSFTPQALPSGTDYRVNGIARDPKTGEVVVVGTGGSSTVTWSRSPSGSWSGPAPVPTVTADGAVESVTAYGGHIDLGFQGDTGYTKKKGFTGTLFLTTRNEAGHWSARTKLPHTTRHDSGLLLSANPDTGHLHAAWTREKDSCQLTCGGLYRQAKVGKDWNHAIRVTHWYGDDAQAIAVTRAGHAITAFIRT